MSVTPLSLSARLTLIIGGLRRAVAGRMAMDRAMVPLLMLLWLRLHRWNDRFARLAAGTEPVPGSAPGRVGGPSGPRDRLPRGHAWLLRLVPEAAAYGAQLQALLSDPAMAALLAADPRTARVLRPLCRMLALRAAPATPPPTPARTPAPALAAPPVVAPVPTLRPDPPLACVTRFFAPA